MIDKLNWRYATKQYDATKKLTQEQVAQLQEAIRLAPTSYGLQPFKVLVIENPEVRTKLREQSWGQPQITDASHLFVFVAQNTMEPEHIDKYVSFTAETRGMNVEDLKGYGDFMKGAVGNMTAEQQAIWNAKQAYIALGILMAQAAEMGVDSTPMEGFSKEGYNEILGLTDYQTVVVAALGFRSADDQLQHAAKVRKPITELFETI